MVQEYLNGEISDKVLSNKLYQLLAKPCGSKDFIYGLELLKTIKSQVPIEKYISVITNLREIKSKLYNDTSPENMIKSYLENYSLSMGLLTLLESYPFLGLIDKFMDRVKELTFYAFKKLKNNELWEFLRALIHGPLTSLLPRQIIEYLEYLEKLELEDFNNPIKFKINLLNMILDNYPVKIFLENSRLTRNIGLMIDRISRSLLENFDEELIREIYSDLTVLISNVYKLCGVEDGTKVYREVNELALTSIRELYSEINEHGIIL